jgi:EAL domain-containing protein (putative c-di-GMP-specific phosphodiesterase class I)
MLHKLKQLGVGLKIDDFGTGYSSLSYLTQLPLDCLKIDRSFVSRMCRDKSSSEVVKTVVELAKSLSMDVVAEGVEESDQAQILDSMGCEYGQGYFYSQPLDPETAEAYIAARRSRG